MVKYYDKVELKIIFVNLGLGIFLRIRLKWVCCKIDGIFVLLFSFGG